MPASNGGTPKPLNLALYPISTNNQHFNIYTFDPTNFNDPSMSSFYSYKVEDILAGRTGTINRVIISYRDLGPASLIINLSGTNDQQQAVNVTETVTIGNTLPLGIIMTKIVGIALTAQNLQLTLVRPANGGPVSITKVRMEGKVETTTY